MFLLGRGNKGLAERWPTQTHRYSRENQRRRRQPLPAPYGLVSRRNPDPRWVEHTDPFQQPAPTAPPFLPYSPLRRSKAPSLTLVPARKDFTGCRVDENDSVHHERAYLVHHNSILCAAPRTDRFSKTTFYFVSNRMPTALDDPFSDSS